MARFRPDPLTVIKINRFSVGVAPNRINQNHLSLLLITWTKKRPSGGKFCGQMEDKVSRNMCAGEKLSDMSANMQTVGVCSRWMSDSDLIQHRWTEASSETEAQILSELL